MRRPLLKRAHGSGPKAHKDHKDHKGHKGHKGHKEELNSFFVIFVNLVIFVPAAVGRLRRRSVNGFRILDRRRGRGGVGGGVVKRQRRRRDRRLGETWRQLEAEGV